MSSVFSEVHVEAKQ